jgi:hypothetical protein
MNKKWFVIVAGGVAAAILAATAFAVRAQHSGTPSTASASKAKSAAQEIQVHGRWTIVVRAHGRVLERRSFENALTSGGAAQLTSYLGQYTYRQGPWTVVVSNPCFYSTNNVATLCALSPPGVTYTPALATARFPVLSVTVQTGPSIVLSGSFFAQTNGTITSVSTFMKRCLASSGVVGSDCTGNNWMDFTSHSISPSIPVNTGQQVQVQVKVSFS